MWSYQWSSNRHLCSHISIHGKKGEEINYKNMSIFLEPHYEDHDSQGHPPPKDGTILLHQRLISLHSLQSSKGHSSAKRAKKSPSKPLKSESSHRASPIGKSSVAPSVSKFPETASPHTPKPHPSSTQSKSSILHWDRLIRLMKGLHNRISGLANVMYSHNNHV